jgi:hypothetical protein
MNKTNTAKSMQIKIARMVMIQTIIRKIKIQDLRGQSIN